MKLVKSFTKLTTLNALLILWGAILAAPQLSHAIVAPPPVHLLSCDRSFQQMKFVCSHPKLDNDPDKSNGAAAACQTVIDKCDSDSEFDQEYSKGYHQLCNSCLTAYLRWSTPQCVTQCQSDPSCANQLKYFEGLILTCTSCECVPA